MMRMFKRHRAQTPVEERQAPSQPEVAATKTDHGSVERLTSDIHRQVRDNLRGSIELARYLIASDPLDAQAIETYITMATRRGCCDEELAHEYRMIPRFAWPELRTTLVEDQLQSLRKNMILLKSLPEPEAEDVELLQRIVIEVGDLTITLAQATSREAPPAPVVPEPAAVEPSRERSAVENLYHVLKSPDRSVREDAHLGLVDVGPVDEFFEVAKDAKFEPIDFRLEIISVLGEFVDPRAINALIAIGTRVDVTSQHRSAAAAALGQIGKLALKQMLELAQSALGVEQDLAAQALGHIGDGSAVPALIELLESGPPRRIQPFVRHSALRALCSLTGEDFGNDADTWRSWLDSQRSS